MKRVDLDRARVILRRRSTQVVGGAVVLALGIGAVAWQLNRLPDGAALQVDGTTVSTAQLRHDVATLKALYGVQPPSDEAKLDTFWRDAAQATALSLVLDDAARREGVAVSRRQVEESLASYLTSLYGGAKDARQRFLSALATAGTSQRAVETEIRRRLVVEKLTRRVTDRATTPTAAEIRSAFSARRCTLDVPQTRHLRNIVVSTRREADAIRADLRSGESFQELARTRSADERTRTTGGDLGSVARSQLEPAYGRVAFTTRSGRSFGPVKTAAGWNLGQVVAVRAGRRAAYDDVAELLGQQLLVERRSDLWRTWLRRQLDRADVRYAGDYAPRHPDRLPAGVASWSDEERCTPEAGQGRQEVAP